MGNTLVVRGGRPLYGTVEVPTAKNSVLPLLAASLLCEGEVAFHRVPRLSDVAACVEILHAVGCGVQWAGQVLRVCPQPVQNHCLPDGPVGSMRASVLFCAPVLARAGKVQTAMPGGCKLGPRPIDIHLDGLTQMGAAVQWGEHLTLQAPRGLQGVDYTLRCPSVGATETLLMAAVAARGETVLRGAACEPEIVDLANFLNACGAQVQGAGTPVVRVQGGRPLHGGHYTPIPDRIVASTLACAVAAAGGQAVLRRCDPAAFAPLLQVLRQAGCAVETDADQVQISRRGLLQGVGQVFAGVYPALATDAAPLLAAALLGAQSQSSIQDTVFENRFACAAGFSAMGAQVAVQQHTLFIRPGGTLHGALVTAPDLRGGAALAVAALAVSQPVGIENADLIARGYEDLPRLLRRLGASVHDQENGTKKAHQTVVTKFMGI
ncbi:MAG: UDP-N-acetylglucosamine 1-carboxyvinyltransferase [Faecalibacterium sp.]|nr:UDP-N-acetylglucosamine 1-carboxyvinyltransferase [Faecalibacterium sp.]